MEALGDKELRTIESEIPGVSKSLLTNLIDGSQLSHRLIAMTNNLPLQYRHRT